MKGYAKIGRKDEKGSKGKLREEKKNILINDTVII